MNRRAMAPRLALALLGLAPLAAGCERAPGSAQAQAPLAGSAIGGDFALVDKAGKPVRYADFAGRYRVVYFGYTFCPDACPLDLQTLIRGFDRFARNEPQVAEKVQPIFISIDAERDTPAVVGEFAAAFSPRLLGLTGTPAQVAAAADAFKVYHAKGATTPGGYLMDHSRIAYLMDRDGGPLATLPLEQGPEAVAAELAKWTS